MGRFFTSLLFLTFTLATIIGISRYYEKKVDTTDNITLAQIEELMKQNPTASGDDTINNKKTSTDIEDKSSFDFLKEK